MVNVLDDHIKRFLHDGPSERWWRRHGIALYIGVCALAIVMSDRAGFTLAFVRPLSGINAIGGLLTLSNHDPRLITWIVVSILAYPLMHLAMRARIYRSASLPEWRGVLSVIVLDLVLVGALFIDPSGLSGKRSVAVASLLTPTTGLTFFLVAPLVSAIYAFAVFINIHISRRVASTLRSVN